MKKRFFVIATLMFLPLLTVNHIDKVSADDITSDNTLEAINNDQFAGLSDDQKIVCFPDGGIIYEKNNDVNYPDYELRRHNGVIKTVAEAKEEDSIDSQNNILNQDLLAPSPFRGSIPSAEPFRLEAGQTYRSAAFGGKGWQFSGYVFYPRPGTGAYLYYRAIGDDGRVGTYSDAMTVFYGQGLRGQYLGKSQGWRPIHIGDYITNGNNAKGFFTYNPVRGSRYEVHN